ncbi:MAG TPA: 4-alpha-glucanotransferase, partial [Mycobacterium sp.]|nr:4-alpha-glucanotransferase [Mycobacterium sp.]
MTGPSPALVELAHRHGVATEYDDWTGRRLTVAESTLVAVLEALGVPAGTEPARAEALAAHDRDYWQRSLPPIVLARQGVASAFWVHVTHGDPVEVALTLEDGTERAGLRQLENNRAPFDLGDRWVGEASFELPADLPLGYHRLRLSVGGRHTETPVVVSPATLALP